MATNFPSTVDTTTTLPTWDGSGTLAAPGGSNSSLTHSGTHTNSDDAVRAVEAKVGRGASTPTNVGDVITATTAGVSTWQQPGHFNVKNFGAVGDGVADDTAAINAALTAASASTYATGGGEIFFPPGAYKTSSVLTVLNPSISFVGSGSSATIIQPTSAITGDVIRVTCENSGTYIGTQAGRYAGFCVDGMNAGTGAVGIHYGDTLGGRLGHDLVVKNFFTTGAIGLRMHNLTYWTERTTFEGLRLQNNKTSLKFDVTAPGTNSFGYTNMLGLTMDVNAGQTGLWMNAGTLYNSLINIRGNFAGTGAVFISIAAGTGGAWQECLIQIMAEASTGTPGTGLSIGASDNIQNCFGQIDLSTGTPANVDSNHYSSFTGHFNCPGISTLAAGDPSFVNGRGPTRLGNAFSLGSNAWSGSGNPSTASTGPMAFTAGTVGDFFFRTDTPSTANQRIYICTVAGTPGTWIALV